MMSYYTIINFRLYIVRIMECVCVCVSGVNRIKIYMWHTWGLLINTLLMAHVGARAVAST